MKLYRHVGIAVTFSPRMRALLSEAARYMGDLCRRVSLVHVGGRTQEKEQRFREALGEAGFPEDAPIRWKCGAPEEALLQAVDEHEIDLLIMGVVKKEQAFRYYLGSVARDLVRNASCSLLLFTDPQRRPRPLRRMVVVTDYSESALIAMSKAVRFAEREGVERIYALRVLSSYGEAMVLTEGVRREEARAYRMRDREKGLLRDFVDGIGHTGVEIEPACIEGHTGLVTSTFARDHEAGLLVMPSVSRHAHFFERLFPTDMEWVLREIPCNLWVAREHLP